MAKAKKRAPIRLAWAGDARDKIRTLEPADRLLAAGVSFMRMIAADQDGRNSFESQETVGRALGLHRTTVARGDKLLLEVGLFQPEYNTWPRRRGYRLTPPVGGLEPTTEDESLLVVQNRQQKPHSVVAPVVGPVVGPEPTRPPTSKEVGVVEGGVTLTGPPQNQNLDEIRGWWRRTTGDWQHIDAGDVDWTNPDLVAVIDSLPVRWDLMDRIGCVIRPPKTPVRSATGWLLQRLRKSQFDLAGNTWLPHPVVSEEDCAYCDSPGADRLILGESRAHQGCVRDALKQEKEAWLESNVEELNQHLQNGTDPEWRIRLELALDSGDINTMSVALWEYGKWQEAAN